MKLRLPLALALTLFITPALAFDDTDKTAIKTKFDGLLSDLASHNYQGVFKIMPPKLLQAMAAQSGGDVEAMLAAVSKQMQAAIGKVKIEETSYDLDNAEVGESPDGRDYALISTRTVVNIDGQRLQGVSPTLAIKDDGQWYLVRLESPQHVAIIQKVYPDLTELEIPESEMTKLE